MKEKNIYEQLSARFETIGANGQVIPSHKWKVNTTKYGHAECVPYIDARQAIGRMNEVFGVGGWSNALIEMSGAGVICEITAIIDGKEITKSNVGTPGNFEKEKSQASDAIKRACSNFGVGAYLYEMEPIQLPLVGKFAATRKEKTPLKSGAALTSYLNTFSALRMKLTDIYNGISKEKQQEFSEMFTKIWEEL